jgi:hypothetical protein
MFGGDMDAWKAFANTVKVEDTDAYDPGFGRYCIYPVKIEWNDH